MNKYLRLRRRLEKRSTSFAAGRESPRLVKSCMSYVKPVIRGLRAKPRELLGDVVLSQSEACTEGKNAAGARTRKGLARKHARMSVSGAASLVGRERGRWILSAQFHEAKIRAATIKFKIHSLRDFCRVHAFKKKERGL